MAETLFLPVLDYGREHDFACELTPAKARRERAANAPVGEAACGRTHRAHADARGSARRRTHQTLEGLTQVRAPALKVLSRVRARLSALPQPAFSDEGPM